MQPNMPEMHGLRVCREKEQLGAIDDFHRKLLHVNDAAPAEVLDHFVWGLIALVHAQVLVADL